ncbi:MAG: prolipoprotein diacylglyceryl transferase [Thermodesulfovibrio sp.]|nr:prolipoprotein diacylglyceryl transferase [Thermodesulfovibrio sp.]
MIPYPDINPEIVRIGPLSVRWYGLMYLIGFALSYLLVRYQIKKKGLNFGKDFVESLYSYIILGLLIGARLGYVIFYNPVYYFYRPLEIFAIWHGGLSFHGGLIGSIIAGLLFCRKYRFEFWQVSDLVIITAPVGLGLGRLGNFINSELYGRITDVPWAMVFPSGGSLPRHPSQLYEFFLEGILLFAVLWILKDRGFRSGILSSIFIILYGSFRFFVEFFREPDLHIGFILGIFTMGQILSLLMIFAGAGILYIRKKS